MAWVLLLLAFSPPSHAGEREAGRVREAQALLAENEPVAALFVLSELCAESRGRLVLRVAGLLPDPPSGWTLAAVRGAPPGSVRDVEATYVLAGSPSWASPRMVVAVELARTRMEAVSSRGERVRIGGRSASIQAHSGLDAGTIDFRLPPGRPEDPPDQRTRLTVSWSGVSLEASTTFAAGIDPVELSADLGPVLFLPEEPYAALEALARNDRWCSFLRRLAIEKGKLAAVVDGKLASILPEGSDWHHLPLAPEGPWERAEDAPFLATRNVAGDGTGSRSMEVRVRIGAHVVTALWDEILHLPHDRDRVRVNDHSATIFSDSATTNLRILAGPHAVVEILGHGATEDQVLGAARELKLETLD